MVTHFLLRVAYMGANSQGKKQVDGSEGLQCFKNHAKWDNMVVMVLIPDSILAKEISMLYHAMMMMNVQTQSQH